MNKNTDTRDDKCSAQTLDWSHCERKATVTVKGHDYCGQHGRAAAKATGSPVVAL